MRQASGEKPREDRRGGLSSRDGGVTCGSGGRVCDDVKMTGWWHSRLVPHLQWEGREELLFHLTFLESSDSIVHA